MRVYIGLTPYHLSFIFKHRRIEQTADAFYGNECIDVLVIAMFMDGVVGKPLYRIIELNQEEIDRLAAMKQEKEERENASLWGKLKSIIGVSFWTFMEL